MKWEKIGLIGLGSMSHHFANRLLENGYELVLHDINVKVLEDYAKAGAAIADTPKEVANQADVVFVSLPTPRIVKEVALGENGIVHGKKVKIYIDLSTTGQKTAAEVGNQLGQKGIVALDAPVSGGVKGAENGSLTVMVSGDYETFTRVKPLLNIIGKNDFYIGDKVGQAQVMKLANNMLSATAMVMTSEVVLLGVKAGIDPDKMISVINVSSGRSTASMDKFPNHILNGKYDYGFKAGLMYKDVQLCLETADELDHPMWLGASVLQYWKYVVSHAGEQEDFTKIYEYMKRLTNTTISAFPNG